MLRDVEIPAPWSRYVGTEKPQDGFAVRLSVDHRPDNAAERRSVGGRISGGCVGRHVGARHFVFFWGET